MISVPDERYINSFLSIERGSHIIVGFLTAKEPLFSLKFVSLKFMNIDFISSDYYCHYLLLFPAINEEIHVSSLATGPLPFLFLFHGA
jgi:hypothetical protein